MAKAKKEKTIKHKITEEDLELNEGLGDVVFVGDEVEIPEEKPKKQPKYKVVMKVNEVELTGEGETISEAILSIPRPETISTDAIVVVSTGKGKNKKTAENSFNIFKTKKLFGDETFRVIQSDYLLSMLSE